MLQNKKNDRYPCVTKSLGALKTCKLQRRNFQCITVNTAIEQTKLFNLNALSLSRALDLCFIGIILLPLLNMCKCIFAMLLYCFYCYLTVACTLLCCRFGENNFDMDRSQPMKSEICITSSLICSPLADTESL